jgi:hypothetical protein
MAIKLRPLNDRIVVKPSEGEEKKDIKQCPNNSSSVEAAAKGCGPQRGAAATSDKKFGAPTITHDGVTVAKEIELEDPFENMGAQLLKEAATKTNDIAGDGTTTSTLLAHDHRHRRL